MEMLFIPAFAYGLNGGLMATANASTFSGILQMATELLTWAITSMGDIVTFISEHPLMTVFLIFTIVGFAAGLLFRIWHSVG